MPSDGPPILRPTPRRPFDLNVTSATPPNEPSTPASAAEPASPNHLDAKASNGGADTPSFSRTRSIMNLTSSTLFGIYSPTAYHEREEPSTPWGTGAETPRERASFDGSLPVLGSRGERPVPRRMGSQYVTQSSLLGQLFSFALRTVLLFCFGMGYGVLVTHLHNEQGLAQFQVEGFIKPSYNWSYLVFWGVAGVGLGSLLPWVDTVWEETASNNGAVPEKERLSAIEDDDSDNDSSKLSADWNPVVRSIGAFVGIAFAIRKLPWTSTLQASLTLALVNPVLWYLVDRSKPGFLLSATVGLLGTTVLLSLSPEMMPSPALYHPHSSNSTHDLPSIALGGLVTKETVECGTWIISVLFCSCVCFGNIGRRLALKKDPLIQRKSSRRSSFRDL